MERVERLLRVGEASRLLGVSTWTLRRWEREGRISPPRRVGERRDRRYDRMEIERIASGRKRAPEPVAVPVGLYVRISRRGDQMSSLTAQEQELRDELPDGRVVQSVFSDVGSGLNENRRGLERALTAARKGRFAELHVTHADRLTRFGEKRLRELFFAYGVRVVVLHENPEAGAEHELMADFMALIASFSGRLYGQRSAAARRRLLDRAEGGR